MGNETSRPFDFIVVGIEVSWKQTSRKARKPLIPIEAIGRLSFFMINLDPIFTNHDSQIIRHSIQSRPNLHENIGDVDKTMDEINEQTENMKLIQEALTTPMGAAADFDEVPSPFSIAQSQYVVIVELEAELEELEGVDLEEQLLQLAAIAPAAPVHVPAGKQPVRPTPRQNTAEEDELAALQAEMTL
ncbi:hypothetical protein E3N88_23423 [Mikania micrantha]|uniref:Uncharacterized protein n=1 Tax=Mikania micrantha TaxID=192012 RepID=A0A5N6NDA5_9ASTR|nr:hypothetical protein E3N88_23423 [Mikania micrantha]